MPVIGRLDEQVNEVLITPIEQGRERRQPADEQPPPDAPTPEPPPEPSAGETSPARPELPVWLL